MKNKDEGLTSSPNDSNAPVVRRSFMWYDTDDLIDCLPQNRPLYKDSGLWEIRTDDMENYELIDPQTGIVFYVGKGKNKRMYSHFNTVKNGKNLRNKKLNNKLKKLIKENLKPIYKKVFETDIEQEAFDKEIELIAFYGKENLCNLADGGEGGFSSKEHQQKCGTKGRALFLNKLKDPKYSLEFAIRKSKNTKNAHKMGAYKYEHLNWAGKHHTEETKEKMSLSHKGKHIGENNSQFGTIWITNNIDENRKINKNEKLPKGWAKGRIF